MRRADNIDMSASPVARFTASPKSLKALLFSPAKVDFRSFTPGSRLTAGQGRVSRRTLNPVKLLRPWVGDEMDGHADETIFLVRRSHPETNRCSIRPLNREEAMGEVIAAAGVLFSISVFVAHAFDAYRTR
jgi:hypothetical protein